MSHNAYKINSIKPTIEGAFDVGSGRQMIAIGRGGSAAYSSSPASDLTTNSTLWLYDTAPINRIPDASISATGDWIESVTLPAGSYVLLGYFSAIFSATGSLEFGWYNGAAFVGNGAVIGASVISTLDGARIAMAGLTLTSSTTLNLRAIAATNVSAIASQGTIPASESWMLIERV